MAQILLNEIIGKDFHELVPEILSEKPPYAHLWLSGGRGSLKSSFASVAVVLRLLHFKDTHAVCIRKHDSYLRDSVFNQVLWAIGELKLDTQFEVRKSPLTVTYKPTGQTIYFKGLDDHLKMKSFRPAFGTVGTVWFEELEQYDGIEELRSVFQSLGRGDTKNVLGIYSFNPPITSHSWVNQEVLVERPDRKIHKSSYLHAPVKWLGEAFIKEAEQLKKINPIAYRHEYLGEVTGTGGNVFRNIEERHITQQEINSFQYIYQGIDWGYSIDPVAFVRCAYDGRTKQLFILDEIYGVEIFNTVLMREIRRRGYHNNYIIADSAEPKSIDEFWYAGFYIRKARKPQGSVQYGIKFLQSLPKIVIDKERTPNCYREFVSYEYEKNKEGVYKSLYPDRDNHCIDAIRYSLVDVMGHV